ncbi:hypothetical protein HDV57DRAFT_445900 [Trichoderma longibrachiatum]|uniref:Zn(2)-C6 fungal-type domain-containing protein n=1 Tax=Trichoderma longibrachiatum ATCC 18648 TaxID=983965 RepID=A0A2T4CG50_TRILO|nr:hypothetical protein M440DRAFT_1388797 [Trichoderma longibrachiatum ATCC 18648]
MASSGPSATAPVIVTPITPPQESEAHPAKEKRRRTGKPKVRTGCVTCKIRRIKCDEQKPACQKCISTGRTCDGYQATTKPKATRKPGFSQQLSSSSSIHSSASSLTLLRPLVTNFSGDVVESQYIRQFLPLAEDLVGITHMHNTFFWGHVVPEYCFTSKAVRHAIVALSSAYHDFRLAGSNTTVLGPPTNSERYIIRQYNLSLNRMAEELNGLPMRKRYGIIMICCVSFFYIEILRGNWPTAMMHLANGIRLMSNLPDEIEDIFRHPEIFSHDHDNSHARAVYMMKLLRRWEGSAAFMRTNSPPSLSLQAYETRKSNAGGPKEFTSLEKLQDAVDDFFQDVNAFSWMCRQYRGDDSAWDHGAARFQVDVLHQRCYHIRELLNKANIMYGDMERAPAPRDFLKYMGCLLRHRAASIALDAMPLPLGVAYTPPDDDESKFKEVASIAEAIKQALLATLAGGSPWFNVDFGVVTTLYIAATNCYTRSMSEKLFGMMRSWPWREDLWDGPQLRQQLYEMRKPVVEVPVATTPDAEAPVPTTPHLMKLAHRPPSRAAAAYLTDSDD